MDFTKLANYVKFSSGWGRVNNLGNIYYPPYSGDYVALSPEANNYINFTVPQQYVGAYFSIYGTSSQHLYLNAYDNYNQLVVSQPIVAGVQNQYVYITYAGISSIKITGDFSGWELQWVLDNLIIENATNLARTINFDTPGLNPNDYAKYVTFSPGYTLLNESGSPFYPPSSGDFVATAPEINNYINFSTPQIFVGFMVNFPAFTNWHLYVLAYDPWGQLVANNTINYNTLNTYTSISYYGISRIVFSGDHTNWWNYYTIDSLFFENATTDLYRLVNFDTNFTGFNHVANYVSFSPGYTLWNSSTNPTYPPHSGAFVVYTGETNNYINFTVPQQTVSAYFTFVGTSSDQLSFIGLDQYGQIVSTYNIIGASKNQLATLHFKGIYSVIVQGNFSLWQDSWAMDDLFFYNCSSVYRTFSLTDIHPGTTTSGTSTTSAITSSSPPSSLSVSKTTSINANNSSSTTTTSIKSSPGFDFLSIILLLFGGLFIRSKKKKILK